MGRPKILNPATCSVDSCRRKAEARGWCLTHYARWRDTGDIRTAIPIRIAYIAASSCSVSGCDKAVQACHLCCGHYKRLRRYGNPLGQPPTRAEIFWQQVRRTDDCWLWTQGCNKSGYGIWAADGVTWLAHRYAWVITKGPIPEQTPHVLHRCDNPPCVNPDHLRIGTHQENMADMFVKSRQAKGMQLPQAKLNDERVEQILNLLNQQVPKAHIARDFSVSRSVIRDIARGATWKHVQRPQAGNA